MKATYALVRILAAATMCVGVVAQDEEGKTETLDDAKTILDKALSETAGNGYTIKGSLEKSQGRGGIRVFGAISRTRAPMVLSR